MKTFLSFIFLIILSNLAFAQDEVTVSTSANYADEVYYSFENHTVKTSPINAWDIAFTTEKYDVSILANNGNGVELYTYTNGDLSDWDNVDTTGMSWQPMYNSVESWAYGAFITHADPENEFDYGWGLYNMTSHNIVGDSLFIIKLASGDYKKLAIVQKIATENEWTFKFANLDGSNETEVLFDADDYSAMNFIHYSIENEVFVEQEADADSWQLLFTRYYDYTIPYMVSGVLSKHNVVVQEVEEEGLDQATFIDYNHDLFSENISTIGSDWKMFNLTTYEYEVSKDVVFFVKEIVPEKPAGDVWKLYFTAFDGMSTGNYTFIQQKMANVSINNDNTAFSSVYPNPANSYIYLIYDIDGECDITIYNTTGQVVYQEKVNYHSQLNKHRIDVSNFSSGLYYLSVGNADASSATKFIKE